MHLLYPCLTHAAQTSMYISNVLQTAVSLATSFSEGSLMPVCMQHHMRSSSAGSRLELSSLPSFEQPAHADASESASLLRGMVSPYLHLGQ